MRGPLLDDPIYPLISIPFVLVSPERQPRRHAEPSLTPDHAERTLERVCGVCAGIIVGLLIAWVML